MKEKDDDAFGGYLLVGTKALNRRAPPWRRREPLHDQFWQVARSSTGVNPTVVFSTFGMD